jgi:hypothetical protein
VPTTSQEVVEPSNSAPPSATPLQSAIPSTPTPAPSTPADDLVVDWRQLADVGLSDMSDLTASAAANNRFVVLGDDQDYNSALWTSRNGHTWTRADLGVADPSHLILRDVTATNSGFIAVGESFNASVNTGVAYFSTDGQTWQQLSDAALLGWTYEKIASIGNTTVALVSDSSFDTGPNYRFAVGTPGAGAWHLSNDTFDVANGTLELTSDGTSFWAFRRDPSINRAPLEVWRSANGDQWDSLRSLPASDGTDAVTAAHGPRGWVVLADAYLRNKSVPMGWSSQDGTTWTQSQQPPFYVTDVFADDAGFIAVGNYDPSGGGCVEDPYALVGLTWTTSDGSRWRRMPEDGWLARYVVLLRRFGRTLIGIGMDWTGDIGQGAVWLADLPRASADDGSTPPATPPILSGGCG